MKKLILTMALLTLGASIASAQGQVNLSWGNLCRVTANTNSAATNDLSNSPGGTICSDSADPFAGGHRFLTSSFKGNVSFNTFAGCQAVIEIMADPHNGAPAGFWGMAFGQDNAGALASRAAVPATVTNCSNPYAGDTQQIIGDITGDMTPTNRTRMHYRGSRVRSSSQMTLGVAAGLGGWVADQADIDFTNATTVPGCEAMVCFNLNEIQYGGGADAYFAQAPELRNWVTYAGGTGDCPGVTPTKNATWGSVKALYR